MEIIIAAIVFGGVFFFGNKIAKGSLGKSGGKNQAPAPAPTKPKDDKLCSAANFWYEKSPVPQYLPRNVWYSWPCYKRVEFAADPYYFLNAEGIRIVGNLVGLQGMNVSSVTGSVVDAVSNAGASAQNAYSSAAKKLGF